MVAKEAMKEQSTLAELAKRYEVAPKLISVWRHEAETRLEEVFRGATTSDDQKGTAEQIEKFRAKVGELAMERDFPMADGFCGHHRCLFTRNTCVEAGYDA